MLSRKSVLLFVAAGALSVLGSTVTAAGDAALSAGGAVTIASVIDDLRVETGGKRSSLFGLRRTRFGSVGEILVDSPIKAGIASLLTGADFREARLADLKSSLGTTIVEPVLMAEPGDASMAGADAALAGFEYSYLSHTQSAELVK